MLSNDDCSLGKDIEVIYQKYMKQDDDTYKYSAWIQLHYYAYWNTKLLKQTNLK